MKNLFVFSLLLSFILVSCDKDDDDPSCDTSAVASVLVGTWVETPILGIGDEVTFNSDNTGSCTSESLFETELNGVSSTTFTWELGSGDSTMVLDYPNGISVDYDVNKVECNQLVLAAFGVGIILDRK